MNKLLAKKKETVRLYPRGYSPRNKTNRNQSLLQSPLDQGVVNMEKPRRQEKGHVELRFPT